MKTLNSAQLSIISGGIPGSAIGAMANGLIIAWSPIAGAALGSVLGVTFSLISGTSLTNSFMVGTLAGATVGTSYSISLYSSLK